MAVITLMTPPEFPLSTALAEEYRTALGASRVAWLAENEACDLFVDGEIAALKARVAEAVRDAPVDFAVQAETGRDKRLLISDMDSTLIGQECIDELADFVGKKKEVSEITEQAMRGELEFKEALAHRVSLLKGLREEVLERAFSERITLTPGAAQLVKTMRARGAYTLLVSGGFTFFTSRVKEALGFEEDQSNRLEIESGMLTGNVMPPILDKEAKRDALLSACRRLGITPDQAMAVGDGANDLPMIKEAGMGVAFRAKPIVRTEADMALNYCDLSALLYVQGYRKAEF